MLRPTLRAVVVLGSYGWQSLLPVLAAEGWSVPRPKFGHGVERTLSGREGGELHLLGCYHVSQQNTFTGGLTPEMLRGYGSPAELFRGFRVCRAAIWAAAGPNIGYRERG